MDVVCSDDWDTGTFRAGAAGMARPCTEPAGAAEAAIGLGAGTGRDRSGPTSGLGAGRGAAVG
jgi:hypothetical protein